MSLANVADRAGKEMKYPASHKIMSCTWSVGPICLQASYTGADGWFSDAEEAGSHSVDARVEENRPRTDRHR